MVMWRLEISGAGCPCAEAIEQAHRTATECQTAVKGSGASGTRRIQLSAVRAQQMRIEGRRERVWRSGGDLSVRCRSLNNQTFIATAAPRTSTKRTASPPANRAPAPPSSCPFSSTHPGATRPETFAGPQVERASRNGTRSRARHLQSASVHVW